MIKKKEEGNIKDIDKGREGMYYRLAQLQAN